MRKIIAIVLSLILLVSLSVSAAAAATRAFLFQEYEVTAGAVLCYGKQLPADGALEVSANSKIVNDVSISTLAQEKIPLTVYCLVDSATSQSEKMVQCRQDVLLNISSQMAEEDTMVIATIDSVLTESKPLDTKAARDTAIKTISGSTWSTNLYDGISEALKTLHTNTAYNKNRCLVIISDGHDDGKSLADGDRILEQVKETGISVYTVLLGSKVTEKDLNLQKQIAEESMGGFLTFPEQDKLSGAAAGQRIWESAKGACVIRVGLEKLQQDGSDQQLLIRYDAADTLYEDTILVRAVDLPAAPNVPSTEPAPEETTEIVETETVPESTGGKDGGEDDELPLELLLACGIGVILLGVGVTAFILFRKKSQANTPEINIDINNNWNAEAPSDNGGYSFSEDTGFVTDDAYSAGAGQSAVDSVSQIDMTMPVENRCHVFAVAIMHPEIAADFYLTPNMEATFGRTDKAEIILNPNDKKLSGCHGSFFWNGKMLLVQDRQSTNGTAVNGEICPKDVWLQIEDGAALRAGNYEYRIKYKVD